MAKRKLLLADDSVTIQKVVNLTFADEGIEVVAVGDGDAAMRVFDEAKPDLVLADVNMPGLDGYQICEAIKQNELTKRIPVILLVGSFEPFDEQRAKQIGADDFLTKPFQSIRQLVGKVSDLLDAKTGEDEFLRPIENPNAPVSSFADTLKMQPSDEFDTADDSIANLGDAGMDDEMIQTAQIGSVPVDEIHKYESAPVYQSFAEDLDQTALTPPYGSETPATAEDYPPAEDWAKTQPLSKTDLEELHAAASSDSKEIISPALDFDESDLLEFPRVMREKVVDDDLTPQNDFNQEEQETTTAIETESAEILKPQEIQTSATTTAAAAAAENLSPELIDAIAEKVAEKLTNRVIKRVVGEVLAQMERRK